MVAALVRLRTHIQAHHLPVLNQGEIATLGEVYQRGVQGPRGHVRTQGCFMPEKFLGFAQVGERRAQIRLAGKELSITPLPKGNRVSFLAPSGAMLVVLADFCIRLGLEVSDLGPDALHRLQEISLPFIRMRNPVDIWAAAAVKGIEFGYREGMEAVLKDPAIDAVVPVLMLTKDTGIPSFDFIIELARKYSEKPLLVTFSGERQYMEDCKEFIEPAGVPTFPEIEQPFEVLSILARCRRAMNRPR